MLNIFDPQPGQTYIDATVNGGGHAREIAKRVGERGRVIGIDWDCDIIREAGIKNQESGMQNMDLVCENYTRMQHIAHERGIKAVNGILFDLGFSSYHVDRAGRGFTFAKDEPLDMRYHPAPDRMTAADIVQRYSEKELSDMFTRYGEERFARRIARFICAERRGQKITTTKRLAEIARRAYPPAARGSRIHPATRAFQALRIAVNDELASVSAGLPAAASLLASGGVIAVIAFHSLEDRIVKEYMKTRGVAGGLRILTQKPIRPRPEEIAQNPRARSARLRAAIRL